MIFRSAGPAEYVELTNVATDCSGKSNRKQARAQQEKTNCRKCEETVGCEIIIAHDFTSAVKVRLTLRKIY